MKRLAVLVLSTAAVLSSGCGDPKYQWTPELLDQELDRVAENLPMCVVSERGQPAARHRPSRARSDGECGGSIEGSSEHDNGITDYDVALNGFCVPWDGGNIVLDGAITGRENGTPSDTGPVVDTFEVGTDGPVSVDMDGDVSSWEVIKMQVEYGVPQAGAPGVPDEANPDRITVGEFYATYSDGTTSYVRDVEMTRVGPYTDATFEVVGGITGTDGQGRAELRTPEGGPLVFDIGAMGFTGGWVDFVGKGDAVSVIPNPSNPGVIDLELGGTAHPRSLDCSAGAAPLLDLAFALILELPSY